jgi:hypothetical protein
MGLKIDLGINPKTVYDLLSFLKSDKPFEKKIKDVKTRDRGV